MNQHEPLPLKLFDNIAKHPLSWDGLRIGMNEQEVEDYYRAKFPRYSYFEKNVHPFIFNMPQANEKWLKVTGFLRDKTLFRIQLATYDTGFDLSLQEIIEKLGKPSYVLYDIDEDYDDEGDLLLRRATLYYPEHGLIFGMLLPVEKLGSEEWASKLPVDVCLQPDSLIWCLDITHFGSIEDLVRYTSYADSEYQMQYLKLLVSWRDYECVEVLKPSMAIVLEMQKTKNQ